MFEDQKNQEEVEEDVDTSSIVTEDWEPNQGIMDLDLSEIHNHDSDTTEEWNQPLVEVIDLKPTEFDLPDNTNSVEELLRSSDQTDEEPVDYPKLKMTYVDMRNSKVERIVNKRKRRRKRRRKRTAENNWKVNGEEDDWVPAKVKKPVRIVLTKRCPEVSESEDEEVPQKRGQTKQSWIVRERRNQDVNRQLLKLKREVDRYKREERRKARNKTIDDFPRRNVVVPQRKVVESPERRNRSKDNFSQCQPVSGLSPRDTAGLPADCHSSATERECRLHPGRSNQGDDQSRVGTGR